MKMLKVVANGDNAKMGQGVGTTYRPVGDTCPPDCGLLKICYAKRGNVNIHQQHSKRDDHDLMKLAENTLARHLVSGDWLRTLANGRKILDRALVKGVIELHRKCPWLTGWGYTHAIERFDRAGITPASLPSNFHLLASCDNAEQKAQANANGWRTARVIDEVADKQPDEFLCPVDAQKRKGIPQEKRTNCARCKACFASDRNIAFLKFQPQGDFIMAKAKTSSMTYEYRDWTGEVNTVEVKGDIILSHPENHIYLARLSKHTFRVHYGLQHKFFGSIEDAVTDFGNCFLHACECDGIQLRKEFT